MSTYNKNFVNVVITADNILTMRTHHHTTPHPFNGLFSRTTWVSRQRNGKPFWILPEQEMIGWQRHQLDHMQIICISLQTGNHANTSPLSFYRPDALPATQPTASKHWKQMCTHLCAQNSSNVAQCTFMSTSKVRFTFNQIHIFNK